MNNNIKLVVLDRDGVINEDRVDYVKSIEEWVTIPGSLEAIAKLNQHGWKVVLMTNQSGIGKGIYSDETLKKVHNHMEQLLGSHHGHIEKIYYCPHHPDDDCLCRKPRPGMLQKISQDFAIDGSQTYVVGDAIRDIEAAVSAGFKPILVETGKGKQTFSQHRDALKDVKKVVDLATAVDFILSADDHNP